MTDTIETTTPAPRNRRRAMFALAAGGLLAIGGGVGAVVVAETRPSVTMAPATPVAIRTLAANGSGAKTVVTIRGRVAEVYGNKFVMADASGRALVDTGREGEDGTLVAAGQTVTVQGRFDKGYVRATFLVGADGKVQALGPVGGPPHDGPGRHGRDRGPDRGQDRGPDGRRDGPGRDGADASPPPPAGTTPAAAPATAPATAK